eukprot:2142248-Rhodomonas_salina.1
MSGTETARTDAVLGYAMSGTEECVAIRSIRRVATVLRWRMGGMGVAYGGGQHGLVEATLKRLETGLSDGTALPQSSYAYRPTRSLRHARYKRSVSGLSDGTTLPISSYRYCHTSERVGTNLLRASATVPAFPSIHSLSTVPYSISVPIRCTLKRLETAVLLYPYPPTHMALRAYAYGPTRVRIWPYAPLSPSSVPAYHPGTK